MADLLALEWDHGQVCGLLAQVAPGRVQVRRAFVLPKPQIPATASGSGPIPIEWLKTELTRLGLSGGETLVVVPRDETVVRRLEVPPTPDAELPVIVRFQAGVKSQALLDDSSLDFIPLPHRGDSPAREVLMATVSKQTITEIRTITELAGLKLGSLSMTPAAVAELIARVEQPGAGNDGESLVVARHGGRVEISVLRDQHLLFSHSARISDEDGAVPGPQAMAAETSRAMVSLRGAVPHVKIERVWTLVGADEHDALAELLHRRLGCEIKRLDLMTLATWDPGSLDARDDPGLFAGALGLLWSRAEPRVPALDFLDPRKPPVVRDTRKQKYAIIGAGAAATLLLLGLFQWWNVSSLSAQVARLEKQNADIAATLKKGEPIFQSADLVAEWVAGGTPWLEELAEFRKRFPATDRVYLESIDLHPKERSNPAQIKIKGFARTREDIMKLSDKFLAVDDRYKVMPYVDQASPADGYYPWRFEWEIQLVEPVKKAAPAAATPTPSSPAPAPKAASTGKSEAGGRS